MKALSPKAGFKLVEQLKLTGKSRPTRRVWIPKPGKDEKQKIKDVIKKHKYSHQAKLIVELNPIIRGWTNYYSFSNAQAVGVLTGQDHLVFLKLRAWSRHRTGDWYKARKKYWTTFGKNNWVFATRKKEDENPLRLLTHTEFRSNGSEYVKVKGDSSPYDGRLVYWSTRMARFATLTNLILSLLKKYFRPISNE